MSPLQSLNGKEGLTLRLVFGSELKGRLMVLDPHLRVKWSLIQYLTLIFYLMVSDHMGL